MSFIEGIGDDLLYTFSFIGFIGIVIFAWLSSYVNNIHIPGTVFIIERRSQLRNDERSERVSVSPSRDLQSFNEQSPVPSSNEISTEHESDVESSENDGLVNEQMPLNTESNISPIEESLSSSQTITDEQENQSLRITLKFLNETQKSISVNANDTISKVKRLYFADDLASNKIIRFIYQGRELNDSETFRTYNIRDQTIIHCHISIRRVSTSNQINNDLSNGPMHGNRFDTLSFIDTSPINVSPYFLLLLTLLLGSIWYIRIKYRLLFTPISTIILLFFTIVLLLFTCSFLLTTRRQVSNTRLSRDLQHVHLD